MFLLAIYIFLFIFAFLRPKSKVVGYTIAAFLFFMYTFSWHSGDLEIYKWVYEDFSSGFFNTAYEPGFIIIMKACNLLSFSFTGFRALLGGFIVVTVFGFMRRQTEHLALSLALYALFPFFLFVSVMRSGIASAFVLLAIEKLIIDQKNVKGFTIFVLLGTLFHYSCILFLPFVFIVKKKHTRKLVVAFIGMCVLTFLINYTDVIYKIASQITQRQKILIWLTKNDASANTTGMLAILILLATTYMLNKRNYQLSKDSIIDVAIKKTDRRNQVIISYKMSIYLLFLSPLMILASPIMRIPYMIFPLFIISTINVNRSNLKLTSGEGKTRIASIPLSWLILFLVIILWKFYMDLPYLKGGAQLFTEYLDTTIQL